MINSISSSSSAAATSQVGGSSFLQKMFARIDRDQDGKVTSDEFQTALEKQTKPPGAPDPAELFQQLDTDSDGQINETEFVSAMKQMRRPPPPPPPSGGGRGEPPSAEELFKEIDADSDGSVTIDELKADFEKRQAERAARDGGASASDAASAAPDFSKLLEALDTDGTGTLSQDEFATLLEKFSGPPPPPPSAAYGADGSATVSRPGSTFLAQA